jgi:sterol 3beta-glucosyltransferase
MRAVLTNFGSVGDLQPFLALAAEIRRRGHEPVLAFSPYFRGRIEGLGFEFIPIGPDLRELQNNANIGLREAPSSADRIHEVLRPLAAALPQVFFELTQSCLTADVLIGGSAQPAARMVHETSGIPFVSIQGSHFGGIGSPAFQKASAALINPFRARLGLTPLRDPLTIDANSPQLAIYAMSRYVRPPQANWPAHYHLTGFFFLDDDVWIPEPDLVEFIESGDKPVIISFGSMTHEDPLRLTELLLEALESASCRAVIQQGWSGLGGGRLPKSVMATGYAPHGWLFSRAKCIVHHGGSGTAGAVFRAGVPSVFVPHGYLYDQAYWAELAHEMGCASQPVPLPMLTAERLAAALRSIIEDPEIGWKAQALAERIRSEPGVTLAWRLIERLLQTLGRRRTDWRAGTSTSGLREREQRSALRRQLQQDRRSDKSK